jgi:hypothetical protein
MRLWVIVGLLIGAVAAAIGMYFLPERDTEITHGVLSEEIRRSATDFGPLVNDLRR